MIGSHRHSLSQGFGAIASPSTSALHVDQKNATTSYFRASPQKTPPFVIRHKGRRSSTIPMISRFGITPAYAELNVKSESRLARPAGRPSGSVWVGYLAHCGGRRAHIIGNKLVGRDLLAPAIQEEI